MPDDVASCSLIFLNKWQLYSSIAQVRNFEVTLLSHPISNPSANSAALQNIFRIWPLLFTSTPDSLAWAAFASHLGHAVAPLVVPCFHSFLLYYIFNPVARWSALKSKSNHVLLPLPTQNPSKAFRVTQSESQSPYNGLCGNIWPPAAFLIQSPTPSPLLSLLQPPPCSLRPPCRSSYVPSMLVSSPCIVHSPCLGMFFSQRAAWLTYSPISRSLFKWHFLIEAFSVF